VVVTVDPLPVANAGTDASIPFGTYIFLSGSVTGATATIFTAGHLQINSSTQIFNPPDYKARSDQPFIPWLSPTW